MLRRAITFSQLLLVSVTLLASHAHAELLKLTCEIDHRVEWKAGARKDIYVSEKMQYVVDPEKMEYAAKTDAEKSWVVEQLFSSGSSEIVLINVITSYMYIRWHIDRITGEIHCTEKYVSDGVMRVCSGKCAKDDSLEWPRAKF